MEAEKRGILAASRGRASADVERRGARPSNDATGCVDASSAVPPTTTPYLPGGSWTDGDAPWFRARRAFSVESASASPGTALRSLPNDRERCQNRRPMPWLKSLPRPRATAGERVPRSDRVRAPETDAVAGVSAATPGFDREADSGRPRSAGSQR